MEKIRNPNRWTRDELILTLNFYHEFYPSIPDKKSKDLKDLSDKLRSLRLKPNEQFDDNFRNTNSVYMKLMNFHSINPNHQGKGLPGHSKLDEEVFYEFQDDLLRLKDISISIINDEGKFSWKRVKDSNNSVYKILDQSCLKYNQSTIPQDFYSFFEVSNEERFENKIKLIDRSGNEFKSRIYWNRPKSPVVQISWEIQFTNFIKDKISKKNILDNERLYFKKLDYLNYEVDIVSVKSGRRNNNSNTNKNINSGNIKRFVNCRVGQKDFRDKLINKWDGECPVTGINDLSILISSHIVPWSESTKEEKIDEENGILLSPLFDSLFDKNLISFDDEGRIIISKNLSLDNKRKMNVNDSIKIELTSGMIPYLRKHRKKLIENEQEN